MFILQVKCENRWGGKEFISAGKKMFAQKKQLPPQVKSPRISINDFFPPFHPYILTHLKHKSMHI